ncbi:IS5 family transposase [Nocardia sp. alder85J]|uniref:IS5 family transposase n=1 Tax=Nocardia sp. alder85J TaxID=2862949 RepID=UPI002255B59D|nr:IS5 family transposase [Nocardia sp. alder85J]MCX4098510.1 IS5 family transposase [Nocardia sp. alder85J]
MVVVVVVGDRFRVLTDAQWELLELLLPKSEGRVGRNFSDSRLIVEGLLYRLRVGGPWRDLPVVFGPWQTVWKRHRRYAADGTWDKVLIALAALADVSGDLDWVASIDTTIVRVHQHGANAARHTQGAPSNYTNLLDEPADHGIGRSRGGLTTKIHLITDGAGRGLSVLITPGQAGDSPFLGEVLDGVRVPRLGGGAPRTNPDALLGDKAYSSAANRKLLRRRRIRAVIPERADQLANRKRKGRDGGRAPSFDREAYKGRNVVERAFNKAKQWRAVATRYDKLALTYRAGVVMALVVEWLKLLGDKT